MKQKQNKYAGFYVWWWTIASSTVAGEFSNYCSLLVKTSNGTTTDIRLWQNQCCNAYEYSWKQVAMMTV